ncbi:MAG: lipoyl(octanoyl) transferase LipB [Thermoanaerobaculia bacterium]
MARALVTSRAVRLVTAGRLGYDEALRMQQEAADSVSAGGPETLFLLEHDPVFTLGRNATPADVLIGPDRCRELGIAVRETDRGGKVTYHGPGQLVGYPVLNLDPDRRDVKRYVTDLEEVLLRALGDVGIQAARSPRPDRITSVWVGNDKIAAIGVHIARWITTHGFAVNVTDEPLGRFAGIVPCGITDGGVTSIESVLGVRMAAADFAPVVARRFAEVFDREIIAG